MKWILFVDRQLVLACEKNHNGFGCMFEAAANFLEFDSVGEMITSWQESGAQVVSFETSDERGTQISENWQDPDFEIPELPEIEPDLVNINTATQEELQDLLGIGPIRSQAVIDGRPWSSVEDLAQISGINLEMVQSWNIEV